MYMKTGFEKLFERSENVGFPVKIVTKPRVLTLLGAYALLCGMRAVVFYLSMRHQVLEVNIIDCRTTT